VTVEVVNKEATGTASCT